MVRYQVKRQDFDRFSDEITALREALAEQPAQQEPKIDIYRSFEQWKNGSVLEHGVPRTEYYSEAQLDLVEMGWNYGYDAGRAVEQVLDKKAENARELGLDYEPAQQEPAAKHYVDGGHLVYPTAQRTWVGLTLEIKMDMAESYFTDEWAINRAIQLLSGCEAALRSENA